MVRSNAFGTWRSTDGSRAMSDTAIDRVREGMWP
jgi:hypothetical protein